MPRTPKIYEEADGWSKWVSPRLRNYRMVCCDCGLAHDLTFVIMRVKRYMKNGKWLGEKVKGHKILFCVRRNKRATTQIRRKQRFAAAVKEPTK